MGLVVKPKPQLNTYFITEELAEKYKLLKKSKDKSNKYDYDVLSRSLSAMVHATKWNREVIDETNSIYKHQFDKYVFVVDESVYSIDDVYIVDSIPKEQSKNVHFYFLNCKTLGLDASRSKLATTDEFEKFVKKGLYEIYFVPNRVFDQFKSITGKKGKNTAPVLKRKISAMICASAGTREIVDESKQIYKHYFNNFVITVEQDGKAVSNISETDVYHISEKMMDQYGKICTRLGLNLERTDLDEKKKKKK